MTVTLGTVASAKAKSDETLVAAILQGLWSGPSERDVSWWHGRPLCAAVPRRLQSGSSCAHHRRRRPPAANPTGTLRYYFGPVPSAQVPAQGTRSIPRAHSASYACEASPSQTRKIGATFGRMLGHVHFAIRDGAPSAPRARSVALQPVIMRGAPCARSRRAPASKRAPSQIRCMTYGSVSAPCALTSSGTAAIAKCRPARAMRASAEVKR